MSEPSYAPNIEPTKSVVVDLEGKPPEEKKEEKKKPTRSNVSAGHNTDASTHTRTHTRLMGLRKIRCMHLSAHMRRRSFLSLARPVFVQSFSRRGGKGKKAATAGAEDTGKGIGAASAKEAEPAGTADEGGDAEEASVVAKPEFKLGKQTDPVLDAIQQEAVALFEAGAYDDAGEKFYYLAEAAHHANDPQQECVALQNMGTSLVMMGLHFEAARCYESAIKLAMQSGSLSNQCEVLECLIWVHTERQDCTRPRPRRPLALSLSRCCGVVRPLPKRAIRHAPCTYLLACAPLLRPLPPLALPLARTLSWSRHVPPPLAALSLSSDR